MSTPHNSTLKTNLDAKLMFVIGYDNDVPIISIPIHNLPINERHLREKYGLDNSVKFELNTKDTFIGW